MPPFTPRRARRDGGGGGGSRRGARSPAGPPKGLFETINSKWYCDCTPRTQAAIRTVQKDGKNKGRKFWICAEDRRDQCNFFIWDDEARARELEAQEAAGLQAPPSTPRFRQTRLTDDGGGGGGCGFTQTAPPPQTPTRPHVSRGVPGAVEGADDSSSSSSSDNDAQMARDEARASAAARSQRSSANAPSQASSRTLGRPSSSRQQQEVAPPPAKNAKKRKRDEYSDEDFESSDMERSLAELTDSVVASHGRQRQGVAAATPATPSRSSLRQQRGAAAATGLPPTPVSHNTLLVAHSGGSSFHKRVRLSTPTGGISSPTSSPTPRTNSSSGGGGGPVAAVDDYDEDDGDSGDDNEDGDDYDVTREVLTLLGRYIRKRRQRDPARLRSDVRACLNGWALRAESVKKARDLARQGMASRDGRIAELQAKVAALEEERAADRRRIAEYREMAKKLLEG